MKTENDVMCKLGKLISADVATGSGNDRFISHVGGGNTLELSARDTDGLERKFRVTVEEIVTEQPCSDPQPVTEPVSASGEEAVASTDPVAATE